MAMEPQQASPMSKIDGARLLYHFGPVHLLQVSKNDMKNIASKSKSALEYHKKSYGQ